MVGSFWVFQCNAQDSSTACTCEMPWRSSGDSADLHSIFITCEALSFLPFLPPGFVMAKKAYAGEG